MRHSSRYPLIKNIADECRGQDLNLRTVEDWDLIPAPLTKLGDPCSNFATQRVYIKTLGGFQKKIEQQVSEPSAALIWPMSNTMHSNPLSSSAFLTDGYPSAMITLLPGSPIVLQP